MIEKPVFKNYRDYEEYLTDISDFIKKNPKDLLAKIDLLRFYSKSRKFDEFEKLSLELQDTRNYLIEREIGRFYLFAKKNTDIASKHFLRAIEINHEEPMWVYYFSGKTFNYYEKLHDNLLYTAIPKNASTSLKNFILDKVYQMPESNPHSQFGNPFFQSQRFSEIELSSSKKILVIREPIERIKSYFNKNILEEDSLSLELDSSHELIPEFFGLPTKPNFEYFIQNLWDYCLVFNDVLHHVLPQASYINDLTEYNIVVDINELDNMILDVAKYLGISFQGKAPRKMVPKHRKGMSENKNIKAIDSFLTQVYMDDYRLLEDYYPNQESVNIQTEIKSYEHFSFSPKISLVINNIDT